MWDSSSPYHLPGLKAVMVSYADVADAPAFRGRATEVGLRAVLGVPEGVEVDHGAYKAFVEAAGPDWKPVAQDFIPAPFMDLEAQRECLRRTMAVNRSFDHDGYAPVVHISPVLGEYMDGIEGHARLAAKPALAVGGIVPQLLRMKKSAAHTETIGALRELRRRFAGKRLHVFGVGGTATIHVAGLLEMDSVDSSGWRNRAARGMIQLPGTGERLLAELGSWRGRALSAGEEATLAGCLCPACRLHGAEGLRQSGKAGFVSRATHNLHVLLEEAAWVSARLADGSYAEAYPQRLDNTVYRPLIAEIVNGRD